MGAGVPWRRLWAAPGCRSARQGGGGSSADPIDWRGRSSFHAHVIVPSPAIGPEDGFMWRRQVELQARANPTGAPEFYYPDRPDAVARQMVASVPLRRLGTPEEVIQTVLFLLSDDSSYITGVDINVSGGNVLGGSRG
mmetsp:Transcript_58224/g.155689  ORF Transcript_58224/g.155689 Transcript_58224/m.155689 type:complete len:138 (+) Transcript_58224:83-496(+)